MKQLGAVLLSITIAMFSSGLALAQPKTPTEIYLAYIATVQKAATLDEVLPYLSKEYRTNLNAQPKEKRPIWLQRLKESAGMKEIKISKETVKGAKCTLEGTAIGSLGYPMKGKVHLLKEAGEWKLDEEGWST